MLGIIIQARLQSSRLPGKILLPFYEEKGILEILIEKLKISFSNYPVVLATSTEAVNDKLAEIGRRYRIEVYRGDENNVLKRFIDAAEEYDFSKVVRICSDNPFLDIFGLKHLISAFANEELDYITFQTSENKPTITTHFGLWAEGVSLNALKKVSEHTQERIYLEHVTNYIYTHRNFFVQKYLPIPKDVENTSLRLTVDTKTDFEVCKSIYADSVNMGFKNVTDLVRYVSKNIEWTKKMQSQIILNSK